jgi:hypothetical protein
MHRMGAVITAFRCGILLKPVAWVPCIGHSIRKNFQTRVLLKLAFAGFHELKMRTFRTRRLHTRCCVPVP